MDAMQGLPIARRALLAAACLAVTAAAPLIAAVPGYTPPAGYEAEDLQLSGDLFSIASDGRMAVARTGAGGATITVYNHADPTGRAAVATFTNPALGYLGSLTFAGNDLLVSENGAQKTLFRASLSDNSLTALAPTGSVPNIGTVAVRPTDGAIMALASNNPGQGAVYEFSGGSANVVATGLGSGYLGGLVFDNAGNAFVGDTNDPFFAGNPGRVLQLDTSGVVTQSYSLAAGGGSGLYGLTRDGNGDLFATTGATITRLSNGVATSFGSFSGTLPFPTDIAADPFGGLVVNGAFTGVGGIFRVRQTAAAIPEPGTMALLLMGAGPLLLRARKRRT